MPGSCSELQDLIAALEKRRDQLIDSLLAQQAAGARTDSVYRQIRDLQQQILKELILLRTCQQQTQIRSTTKQTTRVFTEKTQAIQYFNLNECTHPGHKNHLSNNSIALVQGRQTLLRIYVNDSDTGMDFNLPPFVSGTLHISTPGGPVVLTAVNRPITLRPLNQVNRMNFHHTLNFLLPKEYCNGELSYLLQLMDAHNNVIFYASRDTIRFIPVPALDIHLVNIRYVEPDNNEVKIDKTNEFIDALDSLSALLQVFPIHQLKIMGVENFEWGQPLQSPPSWNPLPEMMNILRSLSSSNSVFVGIIQETKMFEGEYRWVNPGGGVGIFKSGSRASALRYSAYAIGRALGSTAKSDPLSPGNFSKDSIGEAGIDLRSFDIKNATLVTDAVSDSSDEYWTSPYIYQQLLQIMKSGAFSGSAQGSLRKQEDFYHLSFYRQRLENKIVLFSGFHLIREVPDTSLRKVIGINAYIYNRENEIIHLAHAYSSDDKDGELVVENFDIQFPRFEEMHRILLIEKLQIIAEYFIAEVAPEVNITNMYMREKGESHYIDLNWEGNAPEYFQPALSYAVRYSPDGERWYPLVAQTQNNYWCVDLSDLPGGDNCRLQVIASAGLRSNVAETNYFFVPVKRRKLYWMHPQPDTSYIAGSPIHFNATAYSPDYGNPSDDEIIWTSLKHGFLGTGQSLTVTKLAAGKDWIQVHIPDGCGQLLIKQVEVLIVDK